MDDDPISRLTNRLFGKPLIQNSLRGELAEEIVGMALAPDWRICGEDWSPCDLIQTDGPLRIQVKQSAARQSWHYHSSPPSRPSFSIAAKTGRWDSDTWIAGPGRNAEIFVFAWHPVTDESADHRVPAQWWFHVVAEHLLPQQKSISLAAIKRLVPAVPFEGLRDAVDRVATDVINAVTQWSAPESVAK